MVLLSNVHRHATISEKKKTKKENEENGSFSEMGLVRTESLIKYKTRQHETLPQSKINTIENSLLDLLGADEEKSLDPIKEFRERLLQSKIRLL